MPVGGTEIADMLDEVSAQQGSIRQSVSSYVSAGCAHIVGIAPTTVLLVESLVWPFVVRRSTHEGEWFTPKERGKFIRSIAVAASRIHELSSAPDNRDQSFVKYWLDVAMCRVFQDAQRPPRPDWLTHSLFVGFMNRGLNRAIARRDLSFVYSLSKGSKRMWPELGEAKLEASLAKHKERIGTPFQGDVPERLLAMISSSAEEILFDRDGRLPVPTKILPSLSACLQASRREGGAAKLYRALEIHTPDESTLVDTPIRVVTRSLNTWRQDTFDYAAEQAIGRLAVPIGRDDGFGGQRTAAPALTVEVQPIAEPGKWRIITKGDGYLYTALQPLQGQMLDRWKRTRYSTMLDDDLTDKVRKIDATVDEPFWCSGDYEAATDLLRRQCTLRALAVLQGRSPLADLAYESVQPGWVVYPDGSKIWGEEGQLMGHPLSFPLLCITNLAVYRTALLQHADSLVDEGSLTVPEARDWLALRWDMVIVNGDDILFKCSKQLYERFIAVAKSAGLQISVGKNYLSADMCMINSQVFHRRSDGMKRLGYLNLKFVTGTSVKEGESFATPVGIARDVQKMVELAPWTAGVVPAVFDRWNTRHYLMRNFVPNWYMPATLGGFGLVPPDPEKVKYTRLQRKVAALFLSRPELALIASSKLGALRIDLLEKLPKFGEYHLVPRGIEGPSMLPHLTDEHLLDWVGRIKLLERCIDPSRFVDQEREWKSKHLTKYQLQRLGYYRLSPMSRECIEDYRAATVFVSYGIPVPPLGNVRLGAGLLK